jgi:hypothetical protein
MDALSGNMQTESETGVGIGGAVGRTAAWFAAVRTTQNFASMKYGPMKTVKGQTGRNILRQVAGTRSTTDEFTKWSTTGGAIRSPIGKLYGTQREYGGKRRSLGLLSTPMAPSRLVAGTNIATDGYAQGHALRLMRQVQSPSGKFVGSYDGALGAAGTNELIDRIGGLGQYNHLGGSKTGRLVWPSFMRAKISKDLGYSASDVLIGSLYKADFGIAPVGSRFASDWVGDRASGWLKSIGQRGLAGKFIRQEGAEGLAKLGGKIGTTLLGKVAGKAVPVVGYALIASEVYQYASMAFEGAYKLGEAYFYKLPKAAYQSVNAIANRGMGMSVAGTTFLAQTTSNRARAVQAIQGSKMNARSALGQEAGLLAGHFG